MNSSFEKIKKSIFSALPAAKKTTWWIVKIIVPVSLLVSLLQYAGFIAHIAHYLHPVFSFIGLPGESAIVFITSTFLPLYAPIAIVTALPLGVREVTILAVMCLISHNLLVETAIQKKAGSSYAVMLLVRIFSSFAAAYFLNKLLPADMTGKVSAHAAVDYDTVWQMLTAWAISSFWLMLKIWLIIAGLIFLQNVLKEFHLLDKISAFFAPLMGVMGLSRDSAFLWFIAHALGLTYGSAVILQSIESREITIENANLLNYHVAVNHSTLEDTLLFVAIGVPAGWLIVPRFILAIIIVWLVRLVHFLWRKKDKKTLKISE